MKKRLLCFITLLTATISAITLTNNVKAATKWNTNKSVTKEENGIICRILDTVFFFRD